MTLPVDVRPILNEKGELIGAERLDRPADSFANPLGQKLNERRDALAKTGKRLRKFSRSEVQDFARRVLGEAATFREIPVTGREAFEVYGVVEAPGYHRIVNRYSRTAPGEGRRRVVARLSDTRFVEEAKK